MTDISSTKTPWHLWVVGVVSLLWNAVGGGSDYVLTKLQNPDYMQTMADMVNVDVATITTYFDAFPLWMNVAWALGVWMAVAGSVLLLLRRAWAFHAFVLSLIGITASTWYQYSRPLPGDVDSMMPAIMSVVVPVTIVLLAWYSRAMTKRGVLR